MPEFLIWSEEHNAWWRAGGHGYTMSIASAGRFSKSKADAIVHNANGGRTFCEIAVPVPESLDALTLLPSVGH
jgi:hypothetical protein